jgi:hypothetical protein
MSYQLMRARQFALARIPKKLAQNHKAIRTADHHIQWVSCGVHPQLTWLNQTVACVANPVGCHIRFLKGAIANAKRQPEWMSE